MKTKAILIFIAVLLGLTACGQIKTPEVLDTMDIMNFLLEKNAEYVSSDTNGADVSKEKRTYTAENGQSPYAVVVTCSDSRVPPEHIFHADIGELFVIRTAGNVIGDFELGSIEYGAEHLGAALVVVLGHTQCGAVEAALSGGAHGHIKAITDEIVSCLPENCTPEQAERLNVQNSIDRIRASEIMQELEALGKVEIRGAIYNIATGEVEFLD